MLWVRGEIAVQENAVFTFKNNPKDLDQSVKIYSILLNANLIQKIYPVPNNIQFQTVTSLTSLSGTGQNLSRNLG